MKRSVLVGAAIAILAALAVVASAQDNEGDDEQQHSETADRVALETDMRSQLGFSTEPWLVATLQADRQAVARGGTYGFASTEAEDQEMTRRMLVQSRLPAGEEVARGVLGEGFAGIWIDHLGGGTVEVAGIGATELLGADDKKRVAVAVGVGDPDDVVPKDTKFSESDLAELWSVVERLHRTRPDLQIEGYGTFPLDNVVRVSMVRSPTAEAMISEAVTEALGGRDLVDGLVVELLEAPIENYDGEEHRIRGADRVIGPPDPATEEVDVCSAGAWGFVFWGTLMVPLLVTADHCPDTARHARGGIHDPWLTRVAGQNFLGADAQSMSTPDWNLATNAIHRAGPGHLWIVDAVPYGDVGDRVNDWVCKTGQNTGYTCGRLLSTNLNCRGHTTMRAATYESDGGDSGAPVYSHIVFTIDVRLVGIHEGRENCVNGNVNAMYSHQEQARRASGITGWMTN